MCACNAKDDGVEQYVPVSSVAVTSFTLRSDEDVASNLDSVFFSIDLDRNVIFNADSLPKGTDVTKLVPVITFPSTVVSAVITMEGCEHRNGTVDYRRNPSEEIDFSGDVTLRLTASDSERSYRLKVNVHKVNPDVFDWRQLSDRALPSLRPAPVAQKTVALADGAATLVAEADGSFSMSFMSLPGETSETPAPFAGGFVPDVRSLASAGGSLYVLDTAGRLHVSSDKGGTWSDTGADWVTLLGGYGDAVLGIRSGADGLMHTSWPASAGLPESRVAADFPVRETSNPGIYTTKWAGRPLALFAGGRKADGGLSAGVWAFDGRSWTVISNLNPPVLSGATLVPYVLYRATTTSWVKNEENVWLLMGGTSADGKINRDIYVSYDNGVNWYKGDKSIQLPEAMPLLSGFDAVTGMLPASGSLEDAWKLRAGRRDVRRSISYEIDGYEVSWRYPAIYLFGGTDAGGRLYTRITRGVLARVTFMPLV